MELQTPKTRRTGDGERERDKRENERRGRRQTDPERQEGDVKK